ncbi:hypothetical protein HYW17_01995 [Candidatus Uhrbacteria bacterium]|nr:hypothetical protein [Candidatus Uhrbacteria bacterium]
MSRPEDQERMQKRAEQEMVGQRAERTMEEVRRDFRGRDQWAMEELKKSPGVSDHIKFLRQVSEEGKQLQAQMKAAVVGREDKSSDLDTKVGMEALRDRARTWAYHAFKAPDKPEDIEYLQTQWEQAGDSFKRDHIRTTEQVLAALKGELSSEDVKKMRASGEVSLRGEQLDEIIQNRGDMSPEKLATLQSELSSALERLRALEPQVEALAKEKSIRRARKPESFERSPELQPYENAYEEYVGLRNDVIRLLKEIGG